MFKQKPTDRKKYNAFLWILLAVFVLCGGAGAFLTVSAPKVAAKAESTASALTSSTASLFLPDSYEQYLTMKAPSDISICKDYVAVAVENTLYIADRTAEHPVYRTYIHASSQDGVQISKIQFSDDQNLYFSDSLLNFYQLDLSSDPLKAVTEDSLTSLSTFYIEKDMLFEVSVVNGKTTYLLSDLSSPNTKKTFGYDDNTVTPQLSFFDGNLYSVVGSLVTIYSDSGNKNYTPSDNMTLQSGLSGLKGAVALKDSLYYTVNGSSNIENGLYRCTLSNEISELLISGDGFGALTSYDGKLYAVKGNSVLEYSLEGSVQKTDYEISSSSDSVNRLSGATDSARAGTLLVTADAGNNRLSIYDFAKKQYSVLPVSYIPKFVATDGEIIAAASEDHIFAYACDTKGKWNQTQTHALESGDTIKGITCVFGKVYYVSAHKRGVIGGTPVFDNSTAKGLAANLYGDLFVAYEDNTVARFTEETFIKEGKGEKQDFTISDEFTVLRADFEGNLYYLDANGALCRNGEKQPIAEIDASDFVYTEDSISPVSFALGFEDDCVYFNFGNFIVASKEGSLGFPSLGRLSDAKDIVRAGDLLVTADTGNSRITVYDMKKHSFAVIQTDFSPTLVATDGSVIAAADGNKVYVCEDPSINQTFGEPVIADLGTIKGLACVHGSVYYITEYGYGKVEEEDFGLVSRLEGSLAALTADANGILYVVDTSGHVRYFYEDEFIDPAVMSGADAGFTLRMPLSSLRADCKGDLYYIHENEIWKNETPFFKIDDKFFAYDDENELISFALGFEDDEVFLLYGNRIIKTAPGALNIPTQDRINTFVSHVEILLPHDKGRRYYL